MDPKMDPKCVVIQWDVYYKVVKILDNQKMMPAAFSMGLYGNQFTHFPPWWDVKVHQNEKTEALKLLHPSNSTPSLRIFFQLKTPYKKIEDLIR